MTREYMTADQRFASRRPDVLDYETEPLAQDVSVVGPVNVDINVSTSGTDSDWVVKLVDVYPNNAPDPKVNPSGTHMGGYEQLVRGDAFRGKYRNSFEKPEAFEPGKPAEIKFKMQDICHTFRTGHRIMVQVQSSWFPLIDRNPQSFVDIYQRRPEHVPQGDRTRLSLARSCVAGDADGDAVAERNRDGFALTGRGRANLSLVRGKTNRRADTRRSPILAPTDPACAICWTLNLWRIDPMLPLREVVSRRRTPKTCPAARLIVALLVVANAAAPAWAQRQRPIDDKHLAEIKAKYTKYEYRIPMRDGKRLFTEVYVPKDQNQKYPIMLNRTPYSVGPYGDEYRDRLGPSPLFEKSGYIFVLQDVRGRMMSEGEYVNMRPYIADKKKPTDIDESSDTYDTIDWIIKHVPNHNGKVGQWGISYPGFYTVTGMIDAHPGAGGRLAAGAGHRLVHRRRLASQRGAADRPHAQLPAVLRSTATPADQEVRHDLPVRNAGRLRPVLALRPLEQGQRSLLQRRNRLP